MVLWTCPLVVASASPMQSKILRSGLGNWLTCIWDSSICFLAFQFKHERLIWFYSLSSPIVQYAISKSPFWPHFCCRLGAELGFEDPNLTSMVSENLEKMVKQKQIPCAWSRYDSIVFSRGEYACYIVRRVNIYLICSLLSFEKSSCLFRGVDTL